MLGLLEDILGLYCDNLTENPLENKGKLVLETKNNVWGRLRRAKGVNKQQTRLEKIDFGADFFEGIYEVIYGYMGFFAKKGDIWGFGYMRFSKPIYHPDAITSQCYEVLFCNRPVRR